MYRFTALSQLRRKGLGSSGAARSCGIWTSLRMSALLPQPEDFHTRPSSAALNHSLQSGNPCGAPRSKHFCTSTAERSVPVPSILSGDAVTDRMIRMARMKITGSLVCVAVHQGDELLALLPGTIIRSDGIVATSARRLSFLKIKELQATVNVEVLDRKATYEGGLLDADFCSNIAFIKIMSPVQQEVAIFGKLDYMVLGSGAVAVGCTSQGRGLPDTDSHYYPGYIGPIVKEIENKQSDARTSGQGSVIGGPLVHPNGGVVGVIHYEDSWRIKATPIDEVLKYLERLEKYGEQDPKSVVCA